MIIGREEMSVWWFSILMVTFFTSVNSIIDLESPIATARCRAACLFKMQITKLADPECRRSSNCSQCWRACESVSSRGPLCGTNDCVPGPSSHVSPVPLEEALVVNDSRVSWPAVAGPVVYAVMVDGSSLCQTLEPSVTLPSDVDLATVRVLVVDWRGLVKVFGPGAESPVDRALHILRSLGMEGLDLELRGNLLHPHSSIPKVVHSQVWKLEVESIHHKPAVVLGKISWGHYHNQLLKTNQVTSYLVTWSADGDVIRGNLLTNSSTVVLTLLPDALYRIHVSAITQRTLQLQSESLVLDTHSFYNKSKSLLPSFRKDSIPSEKSPLASLQDYQRFYGVTMIFLVFLGLVILPAWRWRHRYSSFSQNKNQLNKRIGYLKL